MKLPDFKYHPDPIATGSIIEADVECVCCEKERGFIYIGPVFAQEEYDDAICPWCIASGKAHEQLEATFTDEEGVGGVGADDVPDTVIAEIAQRTPGFSGWQQEQWWTHCRDGALFLGRVGRAELEKLGSEAVEAIRDCADLPDGVEWQEFFAALKREGSPSAYLFRCRHCHKYGGYHDCD